MNIKELVPEEKKMYVYVREKEWEVVGRIGEHIYGVSVDSKKMKNNTEVLLTHLCSKLNVAMYTMDKLGIDINEVSTERQIEMLKKMPTKIIYPIILPEKFNLD